jgi:glycosyltransferase involved in cell wall biosynthesis
MTANLNTVQEEVVRRLDSLPAGPQISTPGRWADRPRSMKPRIRVLHLIDTLNIGGTENQFVQAALRMHRDDHQVTVGCLRAEGPLFQVLRRAGIPVVEFRKEKTLLSFNGIRQLLRLAAYLRRGRFEVIHAHDLWANLVGVPAGRLARIPVVISSRRYFADLEWYTPWRSRMVRLIYRFSTRVVVNSRAICERLVDRDRVTPDKIRIVYNGVDVERFAYARPERAKLLPRVGKRSKLIAVLANMYSRVKGHACLISAARIVCKSEPGAVFLLIGDGPERSRLETQVRDAGLSQNILFAGRRTDVPELLACCDLSVLASEAEGFPNALLESMSAGLPVVGTAVGGSKEIIENGVNGLLVPPGDPEALAAAILVLIRDPRLAMNLGVAGQKDMRKRFSFDRLLADLDQLYREPLPS